MPSADEIRQQVSSETQRRTRLAVPAFAGGILYLLSAIIIANTLKGAPTVGLFQGLAPALSGEAEPAVSPRAAEVRFISHHTFSLIVGSLLAAIAVGALTLILLLILDATRFRRPQTWRPARSLVLYGGIAVALVSVGHQIVSAIETHNFASGHDFSAHAVDQALTKGAANLIVDYVSLLAGLALAAGMIGTAVNAMRVGLLPRWMGMLGMFTGVLIFLPIGGAELQVVPAFWMVMVGILFIGKWPNAEPPAWAAGEARPWPGRATGGRGAPAPVGAGVGAVPAPAQPAPSSRKRRKRR
ncbi:MAG TPA: hypothetical protein VGN13_03205 [Solirubrobacteraceae bacterium]|jgi:hypothetical protein